MTAAPTYEKISGLTYGTVTEDHRKESRSSWNIWDVFFSVVVVILIIGAYLYFTG
jgi:SSS family solute:Na+ symporter